MAQMMSNAETADHSRRGHGRSQIHTQQQLALLKLYYISLMYACTTPDIIIGCTSEHYLK